MKCIYFQIEGKQDFRAKRHCTKLLMLYYYCSIKNVLINFKKINEMKTSLKEMVDFKNGFNIQNIDGVLNAFSMCTIISFKDIAEKYFLRINEINIHFFDQRKNLITKL